jgi:benzoyl-CoA 2,3-epoxidase subunit B
MSSIDLQSLIPNNVGLGEDRQLQRALEHWQPAFLNWWDEMGPSDFKAKDVYLRTAVGVDASGRASYGYTPCRYRASVGGAATHARPHRAITVRLAQPVLG